MDAMRTVTKGLLVAALLWCGGCGSESAVVIVTADGASTGEGLVYAEFSVNGRIDRACYERTHILTADMGDALTACTPAADALLTVMPALGSMFVGWGGDCAPSRFAGACVLALGSGETAHVTVRFDSIRRPAPFF